MENGNIEKLKNLEKNVELIRDNHLPHIQDSIQGIKIDLIKTRTDVAWIKRFFWIIATTSIGALITGIIQLIINK